MPHPLAGRKQAAEHIAKRVAAIAAVKASWSEDRRREVAEKTARGNATRSPESIAKMAASLRGKTPWNKGNRWQDKLSAEEVRAVNNERNRRRRLKPKAVVHDRVSALVRFSLKRAGAAKARVRWVDLLGYTQATLEAHLLSTLPAGYCWQDYVDGRLQLDHIVPVSAHNFASADDLDFKRCWSLSNLRLITREENLAKRARLLAQFQPSLIP